MDLPDDSGGSEIVTVYRAAKALTEFNTQVIRWQPTLWPCFARPAVG